MSLVLCAPVSAPHPLLATESVSYEFGPGGGQIEYQYERNRRPDRRNDLVAVGFSTTKPDGTLLRIDSDTHPDYLEIKLVSSPTIQAKA